MLHKGLPAEAGFHRHYQHHVQLLQVGEHRLRRGDGPQGHRLFDPIGLHSPQGLGNPGGMVCLQVDAEQVRSRLGEGVDVAHRLIDHQVYVQKHIGVLSDGLDHRNANGDIGYKEAVHYIHMEPIGGADPMDLRLQIAKIS